VRVTSPTDAASAAAKQSYRLIAAFSRLRLLFCSACSAPVSRAPAAALAVFDDASTMPDPQY